MQEVTFDTAKTVLIPVELYAEGAGTVGAGTVGAGAEAGAVIEAGAVVEVAAGEDVLRFNGMAPEDGETVVASEAREGIVAVMAVPAEEWNRYADDFERGGAVAASPLLDVATGGPGRGRTVKIHLTRENVYLAVWDDGLRMAEALPDNSVDSILYFMQTVGGQFKLRKFEIRVSGVRAGLVADALRRYFKKVRVE
jgi:hypothetical protein